MRNLKKYLHYMVVILVVASFGYMYSRILFPKRGLKTKEGVYVHRRLDDNKILKKFIDGKRTENVPKTTTVSAGPQVYHRNLSRTYLYVSKATTEAETEEIFFRYIEEKEMFCKDDRRMGSQHDGGWNVCNSPPFTMRNPCLVYSFGIGNDWVFDDAMIIYFNCTVKAYDPSMAVESHVRSKKIYFKNTGIAGVNSVNEKGWQFKTFKQYLQDSGLTEEIIDYLKIDIEYTEWEVLETMLNDGSLKNVKQLGFEFHMKELLKINGTSTKNDFISALNLLLKLEGQGFQKFNYRKNPFGSYKSHFTKQERSCCYELHYLNVKFL